MSFTPGSVDFGCVAPCYRTGRALSPGAVASWRAGVAPFLHVPRDAWVLDVGAGAGRFTPLLAEWSAARVIGVEPEARMRAEAARSAPHPRVAYVGGRAEALPVRSGTVDAAWLAFIVHHLGDLARAAAELARVLRPGGRVLVANSFPGRLDGITFLRYFPGARRVAEGFPPLDAVAEVLEASGLRHETLRTIRQETCGSLAELAARTRLRVDSTLARLPDGEFARGQAALEHAARGPSEPVVDTIDLLVHRLA